MDRSAKGANGAWPRERKGKVTYDEGEMKFCFQFSLTCGIPSILVSDDGQEVVGDLVA